MASDHDDTCAIVGGVLGGLFAITTAITVIRYLCCCSENYVRSVCTVTDTTLFCLFIWILFADKTKSGQGNGNETVYEYPLPNLSTKSNDLQMETCSAYGVLNTN